MTFIILFFDFNIISLVLENEIKAHFKIWAKLMQDVFVCFKPGM